ncbi:SAM-dependent methyltransferase [Marinobacter pelagius]|uniref:SAM-dependent methyltransferase n=1 Tax=Marinobacter pelagius TaxID=379482 RepID=A0A366GFH7_9GAMM|nr:class I SAM-dependent methyltransferase [Marinobacter pelagius]RBP25588.1 SAM-dependent methyltransferase [Marinobacter pelagius]
MWDERFNQDAYVYGEEPNTFLAQLWQELELAERSGPVLCLAEGEGRNAVHLADLGHEVTCVDLSRVGLDKAEQLAGRRGVNIQTVHADLGAYTPEPDTFAAVVMIFAHTPPQVRQHSLKMARQALKPGGYLILEGYTEDQIGRGTGGPGNPEMMFSQAELEQVFAGDEIVLAREIEREINEGLFHTGVGAVVQFVARKV